MRLRFCPLEKCEHYSTATKYPRKCYYGEPQCWKGCLDLIIGLLGGLIIARFSKRGVMPIEEDRGKIQPQNNKGGLDEKENF